MCWPSRVSVSEPQQGVLNNVKMWRGLDGIEMIPSHSLQNCVSTPFAVYTNKSGTVFHMVYSPKYSIFKTMKQRCVYIYGYLVYL